MPEELRDRKLDSLDPVFRAIVFQLLARLVEVRILVLVIETKRTEAQHQADLASGHSWVEHSKHEDGLAIDICPYKIWQLKGEDKLQWDPNDLVWQRIGEVGESLGLIWGGRWAVRDMGHFEMKG